MTRTNKARNHTPLHLGSRGATLRAVTSVMIVAVCSTFLTGCWSARELNRSALIAGVGFDRQGDLYKMTVQIVQPQKLQPNNRGQTQRAVFESEQTGHSIFNVIRLFPEHATRKLFWSHCRIFVIGSDMAKEGVTQTLNWFYRNQELRPLSYVAVSSTTAASIMYTKTHLEAVPAYDIADDIETMTDTSRAPIVSLKDFMQMTSGAEHAAYTPLIDGMRVKGTAVFLHDKLVGTLNGDESRGLLFLNNQIRSGDITFSAVEDSKDTAKNEFMSLEIIHSNTRKTVQFGGRLPKVVYQIYCVADIADDPSPTGHTEADIQKIEQLAAARIVETSNACITKVKSYDADVIGAGEAIHRANPRTWNQLASQWDALFPNLPTEVQASVRIRHEGLIQARK